jgi:hypothetical protein
MCFAFSIANTSNVFGQSTMTPEMKKKMLQEILKEKIHPDNGVAEEEENDPGGMLRTTGSVSDKKMSPYFSIGIQEAETSIEVDPGDSNNLVASFILQPPLSTPIYYSSNGGATWTKSNFNSIAITDTDFPGSTIIGGGDPAFAWDKVSGTVYFSWIVLSENTAHDTAFFTLNWAYSADKGHTWKVKPGAAHVIGQGALNPSNGTDYSYKDGICDREWLSIDNSGGANQGNLYCSFVNFVQGGECVKVKKASDTVFGPIHRAYSGSSQFGNVVVDKNGIVHMTIADVSTEAIYHVSSSNGGNSWTTPHRIYTGVDLWGQTDIVHGRENAAPNLAVDDNNNLYCVWSDYSGDVYAFYSKSVNKGVSWSTPKRIDSLSPVFMGNGILMPTVATSGNDVSISATVINHSNSDTANYYQITSTDGGNSFAPWPLLLSSAPTYYPHYTPMASYFFGDYNRSISSGCMTYAIWEDGRKNQGPKVYTAAVNHCTTGVQQLTAISSSLQIENIYPNPAKDNVTLQCNESKDEAVTVYIYDIAGKLIQQQAYNLHRGSQNLSMPLNLHSGMYMLSVYNAEGLVATRNLQVVK